MNPALIALWLVPLVMGVRRISIGDAIVPDIYSFYKAVTVIALGAIAFYRKRQPPFWVLCIVVISCLFAESPGLAFFGYPNQFFGGVALLALIALAYDAPTEKQIVTALEYGSIPISVLSLYPVSWGWMASDLTEVVSGSNHASTLYNPNYVGMYAALVLPLLIAHCRVVASVLLATALLFSGSLSGLGAALCGVTLLLAFHKQYVRASVIYATALIVVVTKWKTGLSGRVEIWENTLPLIKPLGSGLGAFPVEYPHTDSGRFVDKPHNMYLQFAHAFGWVGVAAALGGFVWKWRPTSPALIASLVGGFVAAVCNDLYIGVAPVFAVILGASFKKQNG